jgi:hypothetical protein
MSLLRRLVAYGSVTFGMAACGLTESDRAADGQHETTDDLAGVDLDSDPELDGASGASVGWGGSSACTPEASSAAAGAAGAEGQGLPVELPGCPAIPPETGTCPAEALGLTCRYASGEDCFDAWRCDAQGWTSSNTRCSGAPAVSGNPSPCPEKMPVETTPCAVEGVQCGFGVCPFGDHPVIAKCECGRWSLTGGACIID